MNCPECEEKISPNSKECPHCGADIDISLRYSPFRVAVLVFSLSLILFIAIPSILKTLFFSGPERPATGPVLPLSEIEKEVKDGKILRLVRSGVHPGTAEGDEVRMTWEVTVRNQSPSAVLFDTDIRFLDEEGGEVWTEYRVETPILAKATETLTGSFELPVAEADRIKQMRTIVEPARVEPGE